jgi:hypothetical protein
LNRAASASAVIYVLTLLGMFLFGRHLPAGVVPFAITVASLGVTLVTGAYLIAEAGTAVREAQAGLRYLRRKRAEAEGATLVAAPSER